MPRQLSTKAIHARISELKKQARRLEQATMKGLKAAATVIARHSLSLGDLKKAFDMSGRQKRGTPAGVRVAVKYRDDQGNTWTGRGRPPLWLVAAEKAGRKRESFLVAGKKARVKAAKPKAAGRRKAASRKRARKEAAPVAAAAENAG